MTVTIPSISILAMVAIFGGLLLIVGLIKPAYNFVIQLSRNIVAAGHDFTKTLSAGGFQYWLVFTGSELLIACGSYAALAYVMRNSRSPWEMLFGIFIVLSLVATVALACAALVYCWACDSEIGKRK